MSVASAEPDGARPLRVRPLPPGPHSGVVLHAAGPAHRPVSTVAERIIVLRTADSSAAAEEPDEDPQPSSDPAPLARMLAGAFVDVVLGSRSVCQLARWLAPEVLRDLRERRAFDAAVVRRPRSRHPPVVRQLLFCRLEHAVEVTAAVDDASRVRAVALRLEPHRGMWRVTALELG